jgi:hypothetical protein
MKYQIIKYLADSQNNKSNISRTGVEPVTDGYLNRRIESFYSPPLYQLSYHEIVAHFAVTLSEIWVQYLCPSVLSLYYALFLSKTTFHTGTVHAVHLVTLARWSRIQW